MEKKTVIKRFLILFVIIVLMLIVIAEAPSHYTNKPITQALTSQNRVQENTEQNTVPTTNTQSPASVQTASKTTTTNTQSPASVQTASKTTTTSKNPTSTANPASSSSSSDSNVIYVYKYINETQSEQEIITNTNQSNQENISEKSQKSNNPITGNIINESENIIINKNQFLIAVAFIVVIITLYSFIKNTRKNPDDFSAE